MAADSADKSKRTGRYFIYMLIFWLGCRFQTRQDHAINIKVYREQKLDNNLEKLVLVIYSFDLKLITYGFFKA
jgi:hypothetical protein